MPITRGRVEGERIRGTVDTDDGALTYASYKGRTDLSGGIGAAPLYAAPLFETGDERYRWLNVIQAVAEGDVAPDLSRIGFEVYEVH